MSNNVAICPKCRLFNASFEEVDADIQSFDGKKRLQCKNCGAIVKEDEVGWEENDLV